MGSQCSTQSQCSPCYCRWMIPHFTGGVSGDRPLVSLVETTGIAPISPFVPGICEFIKVQKKDYLFIFFTHKRHIKQIVKIKQDLYDLIYTLIFSWWFLEVHVSFFTILYVTHTIFPCMFPCSCACFYQHTLDFPSRFAPTLLAFGNILMLAIFNLWKFTVEKVSFA